MKISKRLLSLTLVVALCFTLCSCGISKKEAVGTWSGTYTYNGNDFAVAFVLGDDGDYAKATYKNGSFSSTETGTYEVKGGKVILHENGNMNARTIYEYQGGKLVNNGHLFSKED